MSDDSWIDEPALLRQGGGVRRSYLARWWPIRERPLMMSLRALLSVEEREIVRHDIALYDDDGDLPVVVVPVSADEDLIGITQRSSVVARGWLEPGHVIAIEFAGRVVYPIGPRRVPTLFRRRFKLDSRRPPDW